MVSRRQALILVCGLPLLLAAGALALSGCSPSGHRAAITIAGSTSVQPFAEMLAEEFMAAHEDVSVNVQGGGSSTGYSAAESGAAHIGMLSRKLRPEETGVIPIAVATDAIAVIVHSGNPIHGLTIAQVRGIFTGEIRNWKYVGGRDRPIHVVTREDGSGTRGSFDETVIGHGMVMNTAVVQDSNGAILETVAADPDAIGYISLGLVDSRVRALALDGVVPTRETARNGSYRIVRPFLFVTRGEPSGAAKEFIDYVLSDRGQALLEENGLIRER